MMKSTLVMEPGHNPDQGRHKRDHAGGAIIRFLYCVRFEETSTDAFNTSAEPVDGTTTEEYVFFDIVWMGARDEEMGRMDLVLPGTDAAWE